MKDVKEMLIQTIAIDFGINVEVVDKVLSDVEFLQQKDKEDKKVVDNILNALNKIKKASEKDCRDCLMRLSKYDTDANVNAYLNARTLDRVVLSSINFIKENRIVKRGNR